MCAGSRLPALIGFAAILLLLVSPRDAAGPRARADASPAGAHQQLAAGLELASTVFVYEAYAVKEPGCGAISAFDLQTGERIYTGPSWAGHGDLAAAPDFSTVVATYNGGGLQTLYRLDASPERPAEWQADRLWSTDHKYTLSGNGGIAIAADGNQMLVGMVGPKAVSRTGVGLYRLSEARPGEPGETGALGARHGYYGTWSEPPRVILPAPRDPHTYYVLTHEGRLPETLTDTVKSQVAHLHTIDIRTMQAPRAPIRLPDLVVDNTPGAGLREAGVHATIQHGDIGYATMLPGGDPTQWPTGRYIAVSRWGVPELAIADLETGVVNTTRLADDLTLVSGIAANHGPENPGLVAVHAGDMIAVYEVAPGAVSAAIELARMPITPVLGSCGDEPRTMGGPIAWSADGRRLIAAANEGLADFVVLEVAECGRSLRPDYYLTACPAAGYNGGASILTANGRLQSPPSATQECPTPYWWPEPRPTEPALLPYLANGD